MCSSVLLELTVVTTVVTIRVPLQCLGFDRLHERVSRRDQPTSRVGICSMSRSFGTLVQLNILLQVCTKLGLARDGRMPDLGSDQGAKHKASDNYAPGGASDCSQRCSQFATRSLPSVQLLATDISDHPGKLHWAGGWLGRVRRGSGAAQI